MSAVKKTSQERRKEAKAIHVLVVCGKAAPVKALFKRKDEPIRIDQAQTPADALDMIVRQAEVRPFDCVLIDLRKVDDINPLNIVAIAALRSFGKLTVIADEDMSDALDTISGIDTILPKNAKPADIVCAVIAASPSKGKDEEELITITKSELSKDGYSGVEAGEPTKKRKSRKKPKLEVVHEAAKEAKPQLRDDIPVEPAEEISDTEKSEKVKENSPVTKGFESSLSLAAEVDQQIWQRFVPVANFLYKKLSY